MTHLRSCRPDRPLWYLVLALLVLAACGGSHSGSSDGGPVAPAAPAGLQATAGNAQVSLSWTASSGATSYHVKRATASGGPYAQVAAPTTTTVTDTALANGTPYFYVVSALNAAGEGANSTEASARPTAPPQAPPVPTGFLATAGDMQISLSWTASAGATSYHVKRATASGGPYAQVASPTTTTFTDSALTNGTTYFYVVSALNASGESANSTEASARPAATGQIPAVPTGLSAMAGNAQVSLSWTASSGATSYHVKRATASGGPYAQVAAPTTTTATDTALANGTTYFYVVSALNAVGESADSAAASATPTAAAVTVTIDPAQRHSISPYVYGINFYAGIPGAPPLLTFDRAGGNRWTAYNWETNASNAGSDYLYENDAYLSSSAVPAEALRSFIAGDRSSGAASLVTVQLQGLVAGDESGPVSVGNPPDLTRFKQAVPRKSTVSSAPFTLSPPTNDAYVCLDELLWTLDQKFPGQGIFASGPAAQPVFVQLDNEPELWNSTHLEVQGASPVTSDTYLARTINLAKALKDQFPSLVIFGPVHYGFEGIYNWQGELAATPSGSNWFPDKYLPALKTASASYGRPLVDVYDFHWYSEATDGSGNRVTSLTGPTLSDAQVQAVAQSPRSLWDPTYSESSWIHNVLGGPIYILGRLQSRIAAEYPGMKLSITEYHNGGSQHIAGTLAQADNLGIFGAQGLFAANFWPLSSNEPYILAGFRAFRGFDGAGASFGDTSLKATSSSVQMVSVHASVDSTRPGRTVFVAINRSASAQVTAITGQPLAGTAHLYRMSAATAQGQTPIQPVASGTLPVSGSTLTLTLPPLSVTTIDVY